MIYPPQANQPVTIGNGFVSNVWGDWFQRLWDVIKGFSGVITVKSTLDFPSVASGGIQELTATVTGASINDTVSLGLPATVDAGIIFDGRVTAANTVTVRATNITSGSINPASAVYRITVMTY